MVIALYVITIVNVLVSAGFAIAGLARPALVAPGEPTPASRAFALYAFARSIPIALVTVAATLWGSLTSVLWLGALAGLVQLIDAYVGVQLGNARATYGPIALGLAQFAALASVVSSHS